MKKEFDVESLEKLGVDITGIQPKSKVERKQFGSKITLSDIESKTIIAKISTIEMDADGDIIIPEGCDFSRYIKNPIILFGHNYASLPIGKALEITVNKLDIEAKIKFADTEQANEIWELIRNGFLNTHSVGFIVQEELIAGSKAFNDYAKANNINSNNCRRIITKWLLLEDSVVNLPSNASAINVQVSVKDLKGMEMDNPDNNLNVEFDSIMEVIKPFPNEHAARQEDPSKYKRFKRQNDKFGAGINVIWGITADGKVEIQSIRFSADKFTVEEARTWLKEHNYKTDIEPATGKMMDSTNTEPVNQPKICMMCDKTCAKSCQKFCSKECLTKFMDEQMPMYEPEPMDKPCTEPKSTEIEVVKEIIKPKFTVIRQGKASITDDNKAKIIAEYKDISKSKII